MKVSPGVAVDDLGRGSEIHAHPQHRALAHDDASGDFRARADEAVVLDDDGFGLQRLQHAADADAAGNMQLRSPICAQEPTVDQVSIMVASST